MRHLVVDETEIKYITEFILEKKFIFHPKISPNGIMDFTDYYGRDYVLILDRNILTKLIDYFKKGFMKDDYIRRVLGSILFWSHFNNIPLNSGLALNEYANFKQDNSFASEENNIFLKGINYYNPQIWLDVAMGRLFEISPLPNAQMKKYNFNVENEHLLMHLSEMYCITRLYYDKQLSTIEKICRFFDWNFNNLLICQYTIVYALIVFSGNSKIFKGSNLPDFSHIQKICMNQAWDITYLSDWSTLYWDDHIEGTVYLFATMDKELKQLFTETHDVKNDIFSKFLSINDAAIASSHFENLRKNRIKPILNRTAINELLNKEYDLLENFVKNFS